MTRKMCKLLLLAVLCVLTALLFAVSISADDLVWNLLNDKHSDYEAKRFGGFVQATEQDGTAFAYNTDTNKNGAYYVYDPNNTLGSYRTFSMEGDFCFESFPSGTRTDAGVVRGPKEAPLSFLCWSYKTLNGKTTYTNAMRIDDEGVLYLPDRFNTTKTDIKLKLEQWYNIRVVFTPHNGVCELFLNDEKAADFTVIAFDSKKYVSNFVRYFDGYYNWGVKMKNMILKSDNDYVVGQNREEAADFIGYQTIRPDDGTFCFRPIFGVNSTEYNRVGYEIVTLSIDDDRFVFSEATSAKSKEIYETIRDADGNVCNIKETFGYSYAAALELADLPFEPGTGALELVVRPYVLGMDGLRRYGRSVILMYRGETDDKGYPVLEQKNERLCKILPSDDTFVYGGAMWGTTVFGTYSRMQVKNLDPRNLTIERAVYFKFKLTPKQAKLLETAVSANLYVYTYSASSLDLLVYGTGTDWDEKTLSHKIHSQIEKTEQPIYRGTATAGQYFYVDVLPYLQEITANEDGSLTASFMITNQGDMNAILTYIESKESAAKTRPYLEIASTIYEQDLRVYKIANAGYEPWGYAEHIVDEWFGELKDTIYARDENGDLIEHAVRETAPNGYGATEATGDLTRELPWLPSFVWTSDGGVKGEELWEKTRFVRTLSTLGTSTANAYLESEYAGTKTEYDIYGGIANAGFGGKATGFFHTESLGGRPYIIDPLGNPYFLMGMNELKISNRSFALEKYGTEEAFFEASTRLLQEMGVNTVTMSATPQVLAVKDGLAVVVPLSGLSSYMVTVGNSAVSEGAYPNNNTLNIFDPDFVKWANKTIPASIEENGYADNPRVLGYTADNELPSGKDMLYRYLTIDPSEPSAAFSYAVAWTWLARKMETPSPSLADYMTSPDMAAMNSEFMSFAFATYYKVIRDAIELADPNHMYLGSRANLACRTDEGYLRAAGHYLDAITTNIYGGPNYDWDMMVNFYRYAGKPFLVTEFFAKGMDAIDDHGFPMGNSVGAGFVVKTQEDRADFYEHHALACIESGACVGWIWYRMIDNDPPLLHSSALNRDVVMAYVNFNVNPAVPMTFMDKEGNLYTSAQVGAYVTVDEGDALMSNLNVNKGVFNRNYTSTVAVYSYDASGKLLDSKSYHVEHPTSATPEDGTVLRALDGTKTFTVGKAVNADGSYTETVLTTFEGTYVALARAMRHISDNLIGIVNYLDAQ